MKKNLTKVLARLAKDGDAETVAEFIGEMIGQNPGETSGEESLTVEVPENREVTIDSEALAGVTERLDQMIALLAALLAPAAPAAEDEDPEEEVAEIVEEVLEAAGGGAEAPAPAEEIAGIVEEILEPEASVTLEAGSEDECEEQPDPAEAKDALRAALLTFRPVLQRMTPRDRRKACADIAARMRRTRRAGDGKIYAALASARGPAASRNLADLGKRIMAARNVNCRK